MKNTWRFTGNEFEYIRRVLDSGLGSGTSGNMNKLLEEAFARKAGVAYAIAFNSGTATLQAGLDAAGVGYGDEVILPPLTVISNIATILQQNAIPVFADIDPQTFNIDPASVAEKITSRTKAIMPVSLYGLSCDLDPIMELAQSNQILVINDAAQAHMAQYKGKPIAQAAHVTSYSLENSKHITTGEGGIVVTANDELATRMRKFGALGYAAITSGDGRVRLHKDLFQDPDYKRHDSFGYNYRMPEIAAAMGLAQTERIDLFVDMRRKIAEMFHSAAADCDYLIPQVTPEGYVHSYWTYAVKYERTSPTWKDFRKKYVEYGGDGIYAAWALSYDETFIASGRFHDLCPPLYREILFSKGICPNAESVQPKIMQFVTNYGSLEEAEPKVEALRKTIRHFA